VQCPLNFCEKIYWSDIDKRKKIKYNPKIPLDRKENLIYNEAANSQLKNGIKLINLNQKSLYETYEKRSIDLFFGKYDEIFKEADNWENLNILDIGGASGYFAMALYEKFLKNGCNIFVVDTTKYDTWEKFNGRINFVKISANNLKQTFKENTFDLIFANRVFHHFVLESWSKTIKGMFEIMDQIKFILKNKGYLCINDHFYNGFLLDKITSFLIYTLTSCKLLLITKLCKKMGAESAGIGVCFLSEKMWYNLFSKIEFKVKYQKRGSELKLKWYKKILLCVRDITLDNVIILKK
jgi:SAM-dependent methyltransferase